MRFLWVDGAFENLEDSSNLLKSLKRYFRLDIENYIPKFTLEDTLEYLDRCYTRHEFDAVLLETSFPIRKRKSQLQADEAVYEKWGQDIRLPYNQSFYRSWPGFFLFHVLEQKYGWDRNKIAFISSDAYRSAMEDISFLENYLEKLLHATKRFVRSDWVFERENLLEDNAHQWSDYCSKYTALSEKIRNNHSIELRMLLEDIRCIEPQALFGRKAPLEPRSSQDFSASLLEGLAGGFLGGLAGGILGSIFGVFFAGVLGGASAGASLPKRLRMFSSRSNILLDAIQNGLRGLRKIQEVFNMNSLEQGSVLGYFERYYSERPAAFEKPGRNSEAHMNHYGDEAFLNWVKTFENTYSVARRGIIDLCNLTINKLITGEATPQQSWREYYANGKSDGEVDELLKAYFVDIREAAAALLNKDTDLAQLTRLVRTITSYFGNRDFDKATRGISLATDMENKREIGCNIEFAVFVFLLTIQSVFNKELFQSGEYLKLGTYMLKEIFGSSSVAELMLRSKVVKDSSLYVS